MTAIIGARKADDDEIPRTAQCLAAEAIFNGWAAHVTYAKGTQDAAPIEQDSKVIESIAVRLARGDVRVVGLWHNGRFSCGLVRVRGRRGTLKIKSKNLKALIGAAPR